MNKCEAISMAAKLTECIAELPDDVKVHGFSMHLNLDAKPNYGMIIAVQLSNPVDSAHAVDGKRYSGWKEKRIYMRPDLYVWWAESVNDDDE